MPVDLGTKDTSTDVIFRVDESRTAGRIDRCSRSIAGIKNELTGDEVYSKNHGSE